MLMVLPLLNRWVTYNSQENKIYISQWHSGPPSLTVVRLALVIIRKILGMRYTQLDYCLHLECNYSAIRVEY